MKKIFFTALALTFSFSALAKDTIPASFQGAWEENKSNCGQSNRDSGLEIDSNSIAGYEESCTLKKILSKTDLSLTGKFSCGGPNGDGIIKVTLTLSPDKKAITTTGYFDGKKFRCE
ncbi:MAG TPA: hypothetical protein PKZ68_09765 [Pseudomonadales bacterium]|jgi:hypothetical protein|nr:hypothetical protein [Pseudomonadales bacterium]